MKRIAAFAFAFLAVCYLQIADAAAQFNRECRYGFCVPGGGPTGTPVSNACINSSGTTITFTAQGTGNAKPNRVSVVTINWDDSTVANTAELTAVTIGGISMTRAVRALGDNQSSNSEIWYVANPTGTTANIVLTFSTAVDGITIETYSLIGYNTVIASTTGTTSVSQVYTNKQLAIAAASRRVNVSTSLSNMTNDFSSACGANLWGIHASQALKGSGTLTSTISPTSNTPLIALAKWAVGFNTSCAESAAFLARTSGLDNTHKFNYDTLICGLVTDGVWANLDWLHVYATQDSTTALLSLVSATYNGTLIGSPTFVPNFAYTNAGGGTAAIDTHFNPTTASSPKYVLNSAHIMLWNADASFGFTPCMGADGNSVSTMVSPKLFGNSSAVYRVNITIAGGGSDFVPNADATGFYLAVRTGASAQTLYKNNAVLATNSQASVGLNNSNFYTLGQDNLGTAVSCTISGAAASGGSGLTGTGATNLYNRLRTYMTAVGIP